LAQPISQVIPSMEKLAVCRFAAAISFFTFGALFSVATSETASVFFSLQPTNKRLASVIVNIDFKKFMVIGVLID